MFLCIFFYCSISTCFRNFIGEYAHDPSLVLSRQFDPTSKSCIHPCSHSLNTAVLVARQTFVRSGHGERLAHVFSFLPVRPVAAVRRRIRQLRNTAANFHRTSPEPFSYYNEVQQEFMGSAL